MLDDAHVRVEFATLLLIENCWLFFLKSAKQVYLSRFQLAKVLFSLVFCLVFTTIVAKVHLVRLPGRLFGFTYMLKQVQFVWTSNTAVFHVKIQIFDIWNFGFEFATCIWTFIWAYVFLQCVTIVVHHACSQANDKFEEEFALNQTLLSQGWNKCYYFAISVFILHKLYIAKFAHLPTIRILMLEFIWSPHECFALVYVIPSG